MIEKIAYLNGFLTCLANLNNGTNCTCFHFINPVQRIGNLTNSLNIYFNRMTTNERFSNAFSKDIIDFKLESVTDWHKEFKKNMNDWFFEMEFSPRIKDEFQKEMIQHDFFHSLLELFDYPNKIKCFEILESSDDIHYKDFLFTDDHSIVHLHLGLND